MLNVIMQSVANKHFKLSVIILNVVRQSVVMISVIMLSVANKHFKLSVVILNVGAPTLKT